MTAPAAPADSDLNFSVGHLADLLPALDELRGQQGGGAGDLLFVGTAA